MLHCTNVNIPYVASQHFQCPSSAARARAFRAPPKLRKADRNRSLSILLFRGAN